MGLRLHFNIVILIIIVIVGAGCSEKVDENIIDRSFMTGEPCAPPCWYGLRPGISTEDEFLDKVTELPFIDQESIQTYRGVQWPGKDPYSVEFKCAFPKNKQCGYAVLSDERLQYLLLFVQYKLSMEEVVDLIGTPDYVEYYPEAPGFMVDFLWIEKTISVSAQMTSLRDIEALKAGKGVYKNVEIKWIWYSVVDRFEAIQDHRMPWPGFVDP